MKLFERWWAAASYLISIVTLSPWNNEPTPQQLLGEADVSVLDNYDSPIFHPPSAPPGFKCDYSAMGPAIRSCSTSSGRDCWLTNGTYDWTINTDYEDISLTPKGILRKYTLDAANMTLYADGFKNPYGKVFNQAFPGPWIQACWGDQLEVTLTNHLQHNGTTIHWHGIRQLGSMEMDGVNGVTQCPVAPGDSFVYRFNLTQYGTSWYHSHYSLQYADGLLGPLTIHGPSSADYDTAIEPLLMQDYDHRSAFMDFYEEVQPNFGPTIMTNILLNGIGTCCHFTDSRERTLTEIGQYNCTPNETAAGDCEENPPSRYSMTFKRGVRYLLRLINTSSESIFVFAIDNHNMTVIGSDFVPINPYITDSVRVGIGQRYHVIVEANPIDDTRPVGDQRYWIRTIVAQNCGKFYNQTLDVKTGILYYEGTDNSTLPDTSQGPYSTACTDEPYESLVPVVPWSIGKPNNPEGGSFLQAGLDPPFSNDTILPPPGNFSRWELGIQSLWLNFSDPTILHVTDPSWDPLATPNYVIVPQSAKGWIYLLITSTTLPYNNLHRNYVPAAHPIHLHGHDFAILQQSTYGYWDGLIDLKTHNPPRRDVALLPAGGYLIIAFRADNPGSWLMHCHIAWHASAGLAVQILERQISIHPSTAAMRNAEATCQKWNNWYGNKTNWWNESAFQDDSGI